MLSFTGQDSRLQVIKKYLPRNCPLSWGNSEDKDVTQTQKIMLSASYRRVVLNFLAVRCCADNQQNLKYTWFHLDVTWIFFLAHLIIPFKCQFSCLRPNCDTIFHVLPNCKNHAAVQLCCLEFAVYRLAMPLSSVGFSRIVNLFVPHGAPQIAYETLLPSSIWSCVLDHSGQEHFSEGTGSAAAK